MIIEKLVAELGWDLTGEADLKRFQKGMSDAEKGITAFAARAATVMAAAAAAGAAGMGALGKSVISTSAEFEGYQATLETIEGSADKAKASLDWVAEFAKTTPYEIGDVTQAFVRLKAYGIDPLDGTLKAAGDAGSAMGVGLMSGVEAIADAITGENERLKAFGITASVAGDQVTYSWQENGKQMSKTLKKSGVEIQKFLVDNFGRRFNDAMDKQSRTWDGMTSNLGDSWTDFQRRIGEAGFFEAVKNQLGKVLDFIARLDADGSLDRWAQNLSWAFTAATDAIGSFAMRIGRHMATIADIINNNRDAWDWLKWVLGAIALRLFPVAALFAAAAFALDDFLTYMRGGQSVLGDFIQSMADFLGADPEKVANVLGKMAQGAAGIAAASIGVGMFAKSLRTLAGAVGLFGTGAAAGGTATLLRLLWMAGAAVGGINALTNPGEGLKNAPRSRWGVDDVIRWMLGTDKPKNSGHPYSGSAAPSALSAPDGSVSARPDQINPDMQALMRNLEGNAAKMSAGTAAAAVTNTVTDNSDKSVSVTVNQTVQQAVDAPAAVAGAVGNAAAGAARPSGLPPTRISGTGAF
ncbi:tape measure protein [Rhizobium cremeum]|uniref:tape measure protein n=1 Tax=Rhizobium cremeum TaxID=2813827 RepID=UPI0039E0EB54